MVTRSRLKRKSSSKDKRRLKRVEPILNYPPRGLDTYYLPTNEQIKKLKRGDYVQIVFGEPYNERMWVIITKKFGKFAHSQKYQGLLANVPFTADDKYRLGSEVIFDAGHIINTKKGSEKKLVDFQADVRKLKPSERDYRAYKKELGTK